MQFAIQMWKSMRSQLKSEPNENMEQLLQTLDLEIPKEIQSSLKSNVFFNEEEFKYSVEQMSELIISEHGKFKDQKVIDEKIEPGQLRKILDKQKSDSAKTMDQIMGELKTILSFQKNWQHPRFFAYYPCNLGYPVVTASLFQSAFGSPSFTWHANPSQTELENHVCDWIVEILRLPDEFSIKNEGGGGFVNSITEGYFLSVNYAKFKKMNELGIQLGNSRVFDFVAYTTEQSSNWSSKALYFKEIQHVRVFKEKYNQESQNYEIDYVKMQQQIENDVQNGLIPFWFGAALGTTGTCGFDNLAKIGSVCQKHSIMLSVDSAYAGIYSMLPEKKHLFEHIGEADIVMINFAKSGMIGLPGATLFVKDKLNFMQMSGKEKMQQVITKNEYSDRLDVIDYKDWSVGFGRKNNAFGLYLTLSLFGVEKYKMSLRKLLFLAEVFEKLIKQENDLQILCRRELGLNVF